MPLPDRGSIKYVYQLPYSERMQLCRILDMNDKWEILGGKYMGFDMMTIQSLRKRSNSLGCSPTDELLQLWGHQNHTILELFVHLSTMEHYQAMLTIKNFVDSEYHRLIYEGEGNLSRLFQRNNAAAAPGPSTSIDLVNFNKSNSSNTLPSKMHGVQTVSHESEKILNVPTHSRAPLNNCNAPTCLVKNDAAEKKSEAIMKSRDPSDLAIGAEAMGPPLIPFKELEIATHGWESILGKGGFGTVYKGVWKNTPVAVKRTRASDTDENQNQIISELRMLNACRHDNILPLYGYSVGGDDPCLIYQFMPNGSLEDRLLCRQGTPALSWGQRLGIAVGTARGLQFLHTINEKPLIHGDIKSANILLDSNYQAKIGDFGLAREGPQSHYTHMKVSRVHGTRPYLPDEFLRAKKFSTKVDTHSFGIVLFELSTGLRAYDDQRQHKFLRDLIENSRDSQIIGLIDRKAPPEDPQTFLSLVELGQVCVSRKPKDRPEMVLVLQKLETVESQRSIKMRSQQQLSATPLSPFELQLMHDQRNSNISPQPDAVRLSPRIGSPSPDGRGSPRYISPDSRASSGATSPKPDYRYANSPNGSSIAQFSQSPTYRTPFPYDSYNPGYVSPQTANMPPRYPEMNHFQGASYSAQRPYSPAVLCSPQSPVISVSPPSANISASTGSTQLSNVSSVESDAKSVVEANKFESEEVQWAANLPNLTVLGIKGDPEPSETENSGENLQSSSRLPHFSVLGIKKPDEKENTMVSPSTAKGKSSLIFGESG